MYLPVQVRRKVDESKTELPSGHMRSYEEEPMTEFPEKHCPKNNGNLSINTKLVKIGKDATIIGSGLLHILYFFGTVEQQVRL